MQIIPRQLLCMGASFFANIAVDREAEGVFTYSLPPPQGEDKGNKAK